MLAWSECVLDPHYAVQAAAAGGCWRSVIAFRNFTEAISRLSMSSVVFVCRNACTNSSGTAVIRPNAVQFMATEILADSRLAFSAGLIVATFAVFLDMDRSAPPPILTLISLAVFWYTRSMVSHAASDGDFSVRLVADWVHLGLISLWVGELILAGVVTLTTSANMNALDRRARAAYVESLSSSATIALTGIFITGAYAVWRSLGSLENVFGNPYGNTLIAKLLLVGVAAALGGYNRFLVMPPWLTLERSGNAAPAVLPERFRRILWVEALVLLVVVMLAAILASTSPPGAEM